MVTLTCPVCGGNLLRKERTLRCEKGHCYDLAKQNYVNLLLRNQSSRKRHGDDKRMVAARQAFLDAGYYAPLRDELCRMALKYGGETVKLLDVGCGEGYYTSAVRSALENAGKCCDALGVDISKTALMAANKRDKALELAVASISALPVPDGEIDLLLSVFAPTDDGEFLRAVKPGGIFIKAAPLEDHLFGLKRAVYDAPYRNGPLTYAPEGFTLLERSEICGSIRVSPNAQIEALFMMTPYYYKTGAADQAKLKALDELTTEYAFGVLVFRKD